MTTTSLDVPRSTRPPVVTRPSGPAGPRRPSRPLWASRSAVNFVLLLFLIYCLGPLLWLVMASTKNANALFGSDLFSLRGFDFVGNVKMLFSQDGGVYGTWYLNSILYAFVGAAVAALFCVGAGYVFDKIRFRGKGPLFALVLISVMVPQTVLALPLYLVASRVGLVNTYWAVLIPVLLDPFGVYLARIFSAGYIDPGLVEAATIDGASHLRAFFSVGLPLLAPGYVTIFLFQLTAIWNNFMLPLVMLSDNTLYPLSLGLYTWNSQAPITPQFYQVVIIGSLLALLPLIVAFLILQRYWRSGLTAGAIK